MALYGMTTPNGLSRTSISHREGIYISRIESTEIALIQAVTSYQFGLHQNDHLLAATIMHLFQTPREYLGCNVVGNVLTWFQKRPTASRSYPTLFNTISTSVPAGRTYLSLITPPEDMLNSLNFPHPIHFLRFGQRKTTSLRGILISDPIIGPFLLYTGCVPQSSRDQNGYYTDALLAKAKSDKRI